MQNLYIFLNFVFQFAIQSLYKILLKRCRKLLNKTSSLSTNVCCQYKRFQTCLLTNLSSHVLERNQKISETYEDKLFAVKYELVTKKKRKEKEWRFQTLLCVVSAHEQIHLSLNLSIVFSYPSFEMLVVFYCILLYHQLL